MQQTNRVDYDVIVVGGRVAGSALAARLGLYGLRVLLLERGEFPSLPAVSSPIVYAPTLHMLDEIGADEAAYARNTPKLHYLITASDGFSGKMAIPEANGRDYAYAVDRARFDAALWDNAVRLPNVEGRQRYAVLDLLWDAEQVVGIVGKPQDGEPEQITARVVIGADGRFSTVARKANAQERDRFEGYPTSIYYAYWRNVAYYDDAPCAVAYEGDGLSYGFLAMDSADGETVLAVEGRADTIQAPDGDVEGFYLHMLQRNPELWSRMGDAEMVTSVRGMKHIANLYRQAGGPGWALVGDAYHQKDPLDGQGIYNAVVTGKALAQQMRKWQRGELAWDAVLLAYDEAARVKTYPMYKWLQSRVRQSFYASRGNSPMPEWAMRTLGRWMSEDPGVGNLMGQALTRQIPPDMLTLMTPPTLLGAIARGPFRDLQRALRKRLGQDTAEV